MTISPPLGCDPSVPPAKYEKVPGLFVFLGVTPASKDWRTAAVNHSPLFEADEAALAIGVRVMAGLAVDYLSGGATGGKKAN